MDYRFAGRMSRFSSSAVRDILKWTQGKDVISFAGGLPAEEWFPKQALEDAFSRLFSEGTGRELQYGLTEGFPPLKELLVKRMDAIGIGCSVREMILTTGSQQAIDLTARILLEDGDTVLTENPTYLAALQVFQSAGASVRGINRDEHGIDPQLLEQAILEHRPKLLYVIPTFANPTGAVWSLERRRTVLELCRKHNVLILEDDPYGELLFEEGSRPPTLMALSGAAADSPVIYTSTFSKTVVPALRTGWAVADERIIAQLAKAKQAADLHSSCLDQQALYRLLLTFDLDGHIARLRQVYRERMETMVDCLKDPVWQEVRFEQPQGGMFLWLELPEGDDAAAFFPAAIQEGVAFVPGDGFFTEGGNGRSIRLNYSHSRPEVIREGMERLQRAYLRYKQQIPV
ncbi:PLP-dependent aminotransferase family protein [Gorillibacterium sp. sgz5001074]|uniref:aminotransferase-like domain-containing protein n=1 Tax=Gorillibacterium sp. sgz5001074 TaxID=3446695 RepID=UPI003F66EA6B